MQIALGGHHTCALSTTHTVKCFGRATWGELFSGDAENRGDEPDEMGDFLSELDFGSNFIPVHIESGGFTPCALGTEGQLKCWGMSLVFIFHRTSLWLPWSVTSRTLFC